MTNYLQGDWTSGCGIQPQFRKTNSAAAENLSHGLDTTEIEKATSQNEDGAVKVLLVSADRFWSDKIADELSSCGLRVDSALDGILAIEKLQQIRPDFIVCDVPMPRMNGLELTCWMRDQDDSTPIILVDHPEVGINQTLSALVGANKLLSKNNNPVPILRTIRAIRDSVTRTKK